MGSDGRYALTGAGLWFVGILGMIAGTFLGRTEVLGLCGVWYFMLNFSPIP